jgi:hypothetical protein
VVVGDERMVMRWRYDDKAEIAGGSLVVTIKRGCVVGGCGLQLSRQVGGGSQPAAVRCGLNRGSGRAGKARGCE